MKARSLKVALDLAVARETAEILQKGAGPELSGIVERLQHVCAAHGVGKAPQDALGGIFYAVFFLELISECQKLYCPFAKKLDIAAMADGFARAFGDVEKPAAIRDIFRRHFTRSRSMPLICDVEAGLKSGDRKREARPESAEGERTPGLGRRIYLENSQKWREGK